MCRYRPTGVHNDEMNFPMTGHLKMLSAIFFFLNLLFNLENTIRSQLTCFRCNPAELYT